MVVIVRYYIDTGDASSDGEKYFDDVDEAELFAAKMQFAYPSARVEMEEVS